MGDKVLGRVVRDKQSAADHLEAFTQLVHALDHKPGAVDAHLTIVAELLDPSFIKSGVKAENRNDLKVLGMFLRCYPVQNGVIVDAQIISEPYNNSVLFIRVKTRSFKVLK